MMELNFDHQKLKTFIRDVLGCGCPEEVFEKMTCQKETIGGVAGVTIDVGGRLLVFLTSPESAKDTVKNLESLLKAGKDKRDTGNFNRLRLVVPVDPAEAPAADLQDRFEELRSGDDKVYIHILHPATIPVFLINISNTGSE